MKISQKIVAGSIVAFSVFTSWVISPLFDAMPVDAKVLGLTHETSFKGLDFPESVSRITNVNIRPYESCETNEQEEEVCVEKHEVKVLVNTYTDSSLLIDIEQTEAVFDLPNDEVGVNFDILYQKLVQLEGKSYTNADAISN